MGCQSNSTSQNATAPGFAVADGAQDIDPRQVAATLVQTHGPGGMDPRVRALIPGFDAPFFQAGLAGYSDAAMRIIARRHGCPICVTEALLDRTLLAGGRGFAKADLGDIHDNVPGGEEDHPLIGQIMGSDPQEMAAAAIKMVEQGKMRSNKEYRKLAEQEPLATRHWGLGEEKAESKPRGGRSLEHGRVSKSKPLVASGQSLVPPDRGFAAIDVNLACPVKKISKKSRGGHWLRDPGGAIAILQAVRDALPASIPVTVKMRRAYDDTEEMQRNFLRIFDAAYDLGCAWVTVHGRTVEQKYVGPSRWDPLKHLVDRNPERIIFGSGDVWDVNQIFRMIAYTGVAGVSVARGCIGNPWIFRQARDLLEGRDPRNPAIPEQRAVLEQHFQLALAVNQSMRDPELHTAKTMRKFGIKFAAHHPESESVKRRFVMSRSFDDWRAVLDEHYTI